MASVLDFNTAARLAAPATPQETERRLDALRARLKAQAPALVAELFPAARYEGGKARIGDASGAPGSSMVIEISGDKAGVFFDHDAGATVGQGDLIDLWRMGQGYNDATGFWRAVEELEQHVGLSVKPRGLGPVARVASERAKLPKPEAATEVSRQTYVYRDQTGQKVLAQVIRIELSDGDKTYRQRNAAGEWKSPEVRPLYNLDAVAFAPTVVLVEGEKCADALIAEGIPATTVMGGSNTILDKSDLEPLRGKQVVTWADNDEAGHTFMGMIGARLRAMGCDVRPVSIPAGRPKAWDAADAALGEAVSLISTALAIVKPGEPGQLTVVPSYDRSLRFLSIDQMLDAKPPRWLIKGVLPEGSFSVLIGPPASTKSFLALEFGLCISHGRPWQGHKCAQGPVVYVAGEGQAGVAPRLRGWLQVKDGDRNTPFVTVAQAVAMPTGQLDELIGGILAMPVRPVLVILDTLARNFGGGDENSATDMGAFVAACDRLRAETGACVLVVHHTGKDVAKGARGSSALTGAADCIIAVERAGDTVAVLNKPPYGKQKDAAEFDDIALCISEVTLDGVVDEDGDTCTTLVLIADAGLTPQDRGEPKAGGRPPKAQEAVLAVLQEAETAGHPGLGMTALKAKGLDPKSLAGLLRALVDAGKVTVDESGANPIWSAV